jgi:VIT1/CCC1 family predicted Fe2+/Mn2+ transporter
MAGDCNPADTTLGQYPVCPQPRGSLAMTTITRPRLRSGQSVSPPVAARLWVRRAANLTRSNVVLLGRNRLAFFYAVMMPLLPLALLFTGERGSPAVGAVAIIIMFQVIALVPVYSATSSRGN